jgi:hypothetical protein
VKNLVKLLLLPLFFTLAPRQEAAAQACAGNSVSIKACGAAGDGAADDSPALQAALDALAEAGGGTLTVPEGTYKLATPVSKSFFNVASTVIIRGHGAASVLHIASGASTTNIRLAKLESLLVENVTFVGTPGVSTDAQVAFAVDSVQKATFRRTDWFGVASAEAGGAVLRAEFSALLVENSAFRGCAGFYPTSVPVIRIDGWRTVSVRDTEFIDYGTLRDTYHSKTVQGVFAWILLNEPRQPNERVASFSNVFMDEGAFYGILSAQSVHPAVIRVSGITQNVNGTSLGAGVSIRGAAHATVSSSYFGFASHGPRNAIEFFGVQSAKAENVICDAMANRIFADAATKSLVVVDSTYKTLASSAANTSVINGGSVESGAGSAPAAFAYQQGGGMQLEALVANPPTITPNVCCPSTTWTYYVVAVDRFGRRSLPAAGTTTQGWASLVPRAGRWHTITWAPVPGAVSYDVLRGNTSTLLRNTRETSTVDYGEATTEYTPPAVNETGQLIVGGRATVGASAGGPNVLNVNGAASVGTAYANTPAPANGMIVQGNLSVGTPANHSTLHVGGSIAHALVTMRESNRIVTAADNIILMDASLGERHVYLPPARNIAGRQITVKKIDASANRVRVDAGTLGGSSVGRIDGITIRDLTAQHKYLVVVSDGTTWHIIGGN